MDVLVYFAPQMGWKWDFIACALGVEHLIMQFAQSPLFADSLCLIVHQAWINKGSQEVTWQKLLDVLWRLDLGSVAPPICDKLME